jgi:hypothetical protein
MLDFKFLHKKTIKNICLADGAFLLIDFTDGTTCCIYTEDDQFQSPSFYETDSESKTIKTLREKATSDLAYYNFIHN